MQIRLPFHYDVEIFSECFTFYKLGMMKSHRDYEDWLFNHGGIFMNEALTPIGDGRVSGCAWKITRRCWNSRR